MFYKNPKFYLTVGHYCSLKISNNPKNLKIILRYMTYNGKKRFDENYTYFQFMSINQNVPITTKRALYI